MARPKKPTDQLKDQRVPIVMSEAELQQIDDWRFANRLPSRSDAIRRLCQIGVLVASDDVLVDPAIAAIEVAERFTFISQSSADIRRISEAGKALAAAAVLFANATVPIGVKARALASQSSFEEARRAIEDDTDFSIFERDDLDVLRKLVDDELKRPLGGDGLDEIN